MIAVITALAAILSLASPAQAGPAARIVIGHDDGTFDVQTVPASTVDAAIARAERDPDVAYAERDVALRAVGTVTPNDPMFPEQWGPRLVNTPEAWGRTVGDPSIVVAVVDTGVSPTNPDLAGALLPGKSILKGSTDDPNGHGTAVAGVIAARGNNGIGVAGYCWACRILPVRALDQNGGGTASDVATGIRWAADNGADIINLSMAGPDASTVLDDAIRYAEAKGVVVVAAAGNQTSAGENLTAPQYPAAGTGVIGVVGTNSSDAIYPWSFRGTWADLAAPGCVATTAPGPAYTAECGTSFAAPAVAGILALAFAAAPQLSRSAVVSALYSSTAPIAPGLAAHGRVDAAALLDAVSGPAATGVQPERVAGADRVATSIELSKRTHPTAPAVVLARSDSYADALAAAPLAARLGAPVLLTPTAALSPAVADEIRRLGATDAWLTGGAAALSTDVEAALTSSGVATHRIAGTSRYDTARQIALQLGGTSVFVTSASSWPDAVAVSGLAASTQTPILLVDQWSVPSDTATALSTLRPTAITVIGGTGVIAGSVLNALASTGATITRLAGATRYDTSLAVADAAVARGLSAASTWVATGSDWPDALAAGPASAAAGGILVLVDGHSGVVSQSLATWLAATENLVIVGGEASVTPVAASLLGSLVGA